MSHTIGLVTVLYNSKPVLPGFFASLAASEDVDLHLIAVTNDQDAECAQMCRAFADETGIRTTVIENAENVGVAEANNQGIRLCLAEGHGFVLIANNDIEFEPQVIAGTRDALAQGYEAVAPLITYYDRPDLAWYAGGSISTTLARTEHHGDLRPPRPADTQLRATGYAPTCFLMCPAEVFETVGLMDPSYFVYYDDSDFMLRFSRAGLRLGYAPAHVVLHKVSSSTGGASSSFTVYHANRNRILFIRKNIAAPLRWVTLGYVLLGKLVRAPWMAAGDRKVVLSALRDGFAMPLTPAPRC